MAYNFSIIFLILFLLIQTANSADPILHMCFNSQYFITKSGYEKNLRQLLTDLSYKTPPTGFGLCSTGHCYDRAYGLALCQGDVSSRDCKTCVLEASSEILKRCPNDKGAIIWYDYCYLKYTDTGFFGKIDDENTFFMWNLNNASMIEPQKLNQMVHELLTDLSKQACQTSRMFASGESEIGESRKIYRMVQCSRNLSDMDCEKCLNDSIRFFCCNGKQGRGVFGGSCNVRYDIHTFLNLY